MIPRREFLSLLPPAVPAIKHALRSPKDAPDHNKRMRRHKPMRASVSLASTAAGLSVTGISVENGFVTLNWIGGTPPYSIQIKIDDGPWTQIGNSTIAMTKTFPVQGSHALIRIMDNCSSLLTATLVDGHARLTWDAPDLA